MIRKIIVAIVVLLVGNAISVAEPIPGSELFRQPEVYSFKLSPDSRNTIGHFNYDNEEALVLNHLKSNKSYALVSFDKKISEHLKYYEWIDNNTLYLTFGRSGYNAINAFVHIDFSTEVPTSSIKAIRGKGYMIAALDGAANKVLYARNIGRDKDEYKVYIATPEQLENGDFHDAQEVENSLFNAKHYSYDAYHRRLMAATFEKGSIYFWYLNKKTNKWAKIFSVSENDYKFMPVGFLKDNKLAVLSNKNTDLISLNEFDIKTQTLGKVLFQHSAYDLVGAKVRGDGEGIEFVTYIDHGKLVTQYFSEKNKNLTKQMIKAFPGKQVYVVSGNNTDEKRIIWVFSSTDPGQFYLFDSGTMTARILALAYSGLDKYELAKSEVFSVKTADNTRIEAILTTPANDSNGVLLVMPHGGPVGIRDYDFYEPDIQYLVSRGYSTLRVNFRGSSGYGKKFLEGGKGQFGKRIEQDITAAVVTVRKKYAFKKMCSMGSSYGGYSALMLAIYHPEDYQCVVAMYGVYDLPLLFNASNLKNLIPIKRHSKKLWVIRTPR